MFTKKLESLNNSDVNIAGGKGASLGELLNAGIPVPDGFVILSGAFERFLSDTDLNVEIDSALAKVDTKRMHTVEDASEKIRSLILGADIPKKISKEIFAEFDKLNAKYVAVRSSATSEDSASAAWAGQLESFLNTSRATLLENVKKCWASLFTPRAVFYRFEKGFNKVQVSVAVVVQEMVQSEKSGIAFSVHPVTQDRNQIIIEAGWGLGEAIVSGAVTPDSYVIRKDTFEILDKNINTQTKGLFRKIQGSNEWLKIEKEKGEKQVLSDKEIINLAKLIKKIESHYGYPVDVEWAWQGGEFFIVQSRPITTLSEEKTKKEKIIYLSKTFTREHILLYGFVWHEIDYKYIAELWGHTIKNFLILRNPKSHKLESWYELAELDDIYSWVAAQCNKNPDFFPLAKRRFYQYLKPLLPYLKNEKELKNLDELKTYYYNWLHWESPMESMLFIPEFDVPEKIKKEAFKIRKETQHLTEYLDRPIIEFFMKTFPQYKDLIDVILPAEIFSLEKRKLSEAQISKILERKNGCAIFRDKVLNMDGLFKALKIADLEFEEQKIVEGELKGMSAFAGRATGKARLILYKNDIAKLKKGEILVSDMTSPNFVPAIRVAGAIVTDEGGTTCHAAIAAREFKIPCVVGTGSATKVIKNGDLVEVDADAGVVRIIKKKI